MRSLFPLILFGLVGIALLAKKEETPETKEELEKKVREAIRKYSSIYGVPPEYLYGIAMTESSLLPKWAFSYHPDGVSFGIYGLTKYALKDIGMSFNEVKNSVEKQTEATAKYLRKLYKTLKNWNAVIQAYHIGIGNYRRGKRARAYLNRVLKFSRRW